jgi:MEMO1 family protein
MRARAILATVLSALLLAGPLSSASPRAFHFTFWSDDPQRYLQAIHDSGAPAQLNAPGLQDFRAGIVTHHFLASALMVRFFESVRAHAAPETIILLGPNHYHHGNADISLSSLPWKTPFGMMETNRALTREIAAATQLPEDTEAYTGEHSVGVLIPLLKYYFPRARVVPILIDANADEKKLDALRPILMRSLRDPRIFVLLSMDFSHNSTSAIADSRDVLAQQAISSLDADKVDALHVDCHKGLRLLLSSLHALGNIHAQIEEHSNSSILSANPKQTNVTSYFTIAFHT